MSLAQLQRALQAHVIDGEFEITSSIESSEDIPAATRLRIYSDAYRLRLIEALAANFPVLAQALGEEAFARLAQEYLVVFPSRHYSIRWFGHRLAEFLSEYPDYRAITWLHELAAWEWKIATSFDAADAALLGMNDLAGVAPNEWADLRLTLHPSVQRIALESNVVAIVKAKDREESLPVPAKQTRTEWLIWRQDLGVLYRSLDIIEAAAIDAIRHGASFGEMCESMAEHGATEDQVPLLAAGYLKQWLTDQCLCAM
jgi:hypothetical protein